MNDNKKGVDLAKGTDQIVFVTPVQKGVKFYELPKDITAPLIYLRVRQSAWHLEYRTIILHSTPNETIINGIEARFQIQNDLH